MSSLDELYENASVSILDVKKNASLGACSYVMISKGNLFSFEVNLLGCRYISLELSLILKFLSTLFTTLMSSFLYFQSFVCS